MVVGGDSTPEEDLLNAWKYDSNRPEFTWMKVRCQANQSIREWTVIDHGKNGDGSMARTTGLVTYALASLFATKGPEYCGLQPGVHPPEHVNKETLDAVLKIFETNDVSVS
jgi:hypothetical protein